MWGDEDGPNGIGVVEDIWRRAMRLELRADVEVMSECEFRRELDYWFKGRNHDDDRLRALSAPPKPPRKRRERVPASMAGDLAELNNLARERLSTAQ